MWAWLRGKGRVDYQTPPNEATYESRQAALAGVDIRLSELAGIPSDLRTVEQWDELDRLLARRKRLTEQTVPMVPGRAEKSIEEYGKNPW